MALVKILYICQGHILPICGQVSCDYTCSQSLRMVHNDVRKSHHDNGAKPARDAC